MSIHRALLLPLLLVAVACKPQLTATVTGQLAGESDATTARVHVWNQRVIDSPESSLTGLSVQLEVWRVPDGSLGEGFEDRMVLDEIAGDEAPDAAGRFTFQEVPALPNDKLPVWPGLLFVRIVQDDTALIPYGAGAQITHVLEGETLPLSLPLVTELRLPIWHEPTPDQSMKGPHAVADPTRDVVVYLSPDRGFGVYDPSRETVDVLLTASALDFEVPFTRLEVLGETGVAVAAAVSDSSTMPRDAARFVFVDLDLFTDPDVSEWVDLDEAQLDPAIAARVAIVDVPGDPDASELGWRWLGAPTLRPHTIVTADGGRYYHARWGSTYVFDLATREVVDTWHDDAYLGGYNPDLDHLYLDTASRTLRIVEGATGETLADVDLGATHLLGLAAIPGADRTLVFYESAGTALAHRAAIVDGTGAVVVDELAGVLLGYPDRFWNPAYDWGTCGPAFYRGPDCPACTNDPPTDFLPGPALSYDPPALPYFSPFFDTLRDELVIPEYDARFAYVGGAFHPKPGINCGRFRFTTECNGLPIFDVQNQVAILSTMSDVVCIQHVTGDDLTVPVQVPRTSAGFSVPTFLSSQGTAYVPGVDGLTAIHYRNPDAASLPAIRDLREVFDAR